MKEALALLIFLACASSSFGQAQAADPALSAPLARKTVATTFILDEPDQYCTVSPVSSDGYMVTALHCLRDCLLENGVGEAGSIPYANFDLFVSVKPQGIVCKNLSIPALSVRQVTVVETGTALSQFDAHFMFTYPDAVNELRTHNMITRANDYAILKINPPRPLACWPLASVPAAPGSSIWAVGYPLPADPSKQKPVLTVTPGHVYASAQESVAYRRSTSTDEQAYMTTLYSDSAILYSNAATAFGQSGGPVIDAAGSLVGVVSGFTMVGEPSVHELVAVTSTSLLKGLSPALQATLIRSSAQCR